MPQNHLFPHNSRALPASGPAHDSGRALPVPYTTVSYSRRAETEPTTLAGFWRILTRRKGIILAVTALCALAGFFLTRLQSPLYRARTLLEINTLNEDFLNMRSVSPNAAAEGTLQPPDYNIRTQAMIVQSRPVLERVVDTGDLQARLIASAPPSRFAQWRASRSEPARPATPRERAIAIASAGLKARAEPNTRVVEVTFDSPDSKLAADVSNTVASAYSTLNLDRRWQTSQNTGEWLSRQLADVKAKLEHSEDAMQAYANDAGLSFLDGKESTAEERLRQLQVELLRAQADRVVKQAAFEQVSSAAPETLPQVLDDTTLKAYQEQLTNLRKDYARLNTQLTPESPKVQDVQAQIDALESALQRKRSEIVARIRNEYNAASQRENLLTADYSRQQKLVSQQATRVARYSNLKREVDSTSQLYESLTQKVKEAGLASAMKASDVRVIEAAAAPRLPFTPNVWLNSAFGLFTGLLLSSLFVIQRARAYRGIQTPGEMAVHLNLPELGVIPASQPRFARMRKLLGKSDPDGPLELRTSQEELSTIAGSFRFTLASILLAGENGSAPKAIVVSSAHPGEGKTTVISNLAIALAQVNRRVLLVDADWRKPRLHELFEVENHLGLGEALASDPASLVRATKVPNLFVLASGRQTNERVFFDPRLPSLVKRLKADYDMILIDTPPLLGMPEARLMGRYADAMVLVVAQHTDRDAVLLAQQRLFEDGSYLLGTILNNWNPKTTVNGSSEYSEYYKSGDRYAASRAHA